MVVSREFPVQSPLIGVFPFNGVNELMGQHLTSTPAYMMGMAILEGATDIGIYGVDMAVDSKEYFHQRPSMYAWIAFAKAKGIKITIPEESSLFKDDYVEGQGVLKGTPPFTEEQLLGMAKTHRNSMNKYEAERSRIEQLIQTHDGARQVYERLAKVARAIESGIPVESLSETTVVK